MPELSAGGVTWHYAAAPAAPRNPAIVFLHGAGANHTIWLGQMKALRDDAWVVIPDLPGHGRSTEIPGLTIEEYAEALVFFLDALRPALPAGENRRFVLAGHSMGGAIALLAALGRPELLAGLVLIGTGAKLGVSPEILDGLETSPSETQAMVARWSFAKDADPALVLRTMKDLVGTAPRRTLADFRACNGFDIRKDLGRIPLPSLVVCGTEDKLTPPRYSEFLRERLPNATLRSIEGAGHAVMIEASEAVSRAIAEFLRARGPLP